MQQLLEDQGATSFDFADSEGDAVAAAIRCHSDIIMSDVKLIEGTGPAAVHTIRERLGEIPVIFITATPAECEPCNPPGVVLGKPINARAVRAAFNAARH